MRLSVALLFMLTFCLAKASGQNFRNDWSTFSDSIWSVKFRESSGSFYENKSYGFLGFVCKRDSTISLYFSVFKEAEWHMDQKTLNDYFMSLNCQGLGFPDFTKGDYFYFAEPCSRCYSHTIGDSLKPECHYLYVKLYGTEYPFHH